MCNFLGLFEALNIDSLLLPFYQKGGINTNVRYGGIYIRSLVIGGAAELDRRIQIGNLFILNVPIKTQNFL